VIHAEADDWQSAMHQADGRPLGVVHLERLARGEGHLDEPGHEALVDVFVRFKDVRKHLGDRFVHARFGVDLDGRIHDRIEPPQVVDTQDVVHVVVRVQHRVDPTEPGADRLPTQVRAGVNEVLALVACVVVITDHHAAAVAAVARVGGSAGAVGFVAADHRHTGAGAGAQEFKT